jgi:hypothetical protein
MLNKIKWIIDRWRIMQHPSEDLYRIRQQIQYRIIDYIWYKRTPPSRGFQNNYLFPEKYDKESLERITKVLSKDLKPFKLLNVTIDDIFDNHFWNYDFKNKKVAPTCFVHHIDDFDYNIGEVKYVYELSRLYQMPIIAAYAVAKEDKHIARHCLDQLMEWFTQNPFLGTIAWKSGNVVGIRTINLTITFDLLSFFPEIIHEYKTRLNRLMELHYMYLNSHQSLFSSRGNHHIGELAGLIAISTHFRYKNSDKELKTQMDELDSEILRLIHSDGFNKEQATRYQASYFNLFVVSWLFGKEKGYDISLESKQRLKNMVKILRDWKVGSGEFFHIGDNDNAELMYPYTDFSYNVYESILNDGCVLFGEEKQEDYHFDLRNYLLYGKNGLSIYNYSSSSNRPDYLTKIYPHSGYFVIKDPQIALLFDVGPIGLMPSMAHGHSDILSFVLYVGGIPIIVDCGSYQYNNHYKKYRDYFHGVHSHNTISIDGKDQAKNGAGMFWLSNPDVRILDSSLEGNNVWCVASHNGYSREGSSIIHERRLEYDKQKKIIVLSDVIRKGNHNALFYYLHFHPSVEIEHNRNVLKTDRITIINNIFEKGELIKADKEKPLGWYSSGYDSIEPTHTFVVKVNFDKETKIETIIKL